MSSLNESLCGADVGFVMSCFLSLWPFLEKITSNANLLVWQISSFLLGGWLGGEWLT